ncbi:MAG: toll/interleukin-1 receptor domain-containing protein [Erysipelotrichales bacterium]|nr:toll/interleukin-1 receptor domain-containing protein [Erysipelotrichales bacterium]
MDNYEVFICYRGESQETVSIGGQIHTLLTYSKSTKCFFAPYSIKKGEDFKKIIPSVMENIKVIVLLLSNNFFRSCSKEDDIVYYELKEALKNEKSKFLPVIFDKFNYNNESLELFTEKEIDRFKHINALEYHTPYSFDFEKLINTICLLKGDYVDTDEINRMLMKVINRTLGESSDIKLAKHTFMVHKTNPSAQESRLVSGDTFQIMTNSLTYDLDADSIRMIANSISIGVKYYYYIEKNKITYNFLGKFIKGLCYSMASSYSYEHKIKILCENLHIYWLPENTYPYSFTLINRPQSYDIDHCSFYFIKKEKEYQLYEVLLDKAQDLVDDLRYIFSQFRQNMPRVDLLEYLVK